VEASSNFWEIVYNNQKFPIKTKTILWTECPFWSTPLKNKLVYKTKRKINFFVNHWDACQTSEDCYKILTSRGLSCHFLLDENGIIYQTMDLNDVAWHAAGINLRSVGVEICNPVDIKYQNKQKQRPIKKNVKVHRQILKNILWFYPEQIEALKKLWEAISLALKIPLISPLDKNENQIETVFSGLKNFSGFICHFHCNHHKIDVAGLELKENLNSIKKSLTGIED
jgi:hypothetical protein